MSDDNFGPWIDWAGGECPIPNAKAGEFEVMYAKGITGARHHAALDHSWVQRHPDWAVVAYRVRLPADDLLRQAIEALRLVKRMNDEALPKFNWGASALDANAIQLLNETPQAVNAVLTAYDKREQS